MSNYLVVMEAAWLVRDVESIDDAIGVAVSEAGRRLNDKDMDYVEVDVGATGCPACGEPFDDLVVCEDEFNSLELSMPLDLCTTAHDDQVLLFTHKP